VCKKYVGGQHMKKYVIILIIFYSFIGISTNYAKSATAEEQFERYDSKTMFENHNSVMLIIDSSTGNILDVNLAATRFYGYTYEDMLQMKISDLNILSDEEIKAEMNAALAEKRNFFEFKHRLSDGSLRDVEVFSSPASDKNGNTILYSIVHDVTEAHLAEKVADRVRMIVFALLSAIILILTMGLIIVNQLKKRENISKNKFKSLFDNMNEGFALHEVVLNENGNVIDYRFLDVNGAFERITGLSEKTIQNKCVKEILPNIEQYWIDTYGEVALTGVAKSFTNYTSEIDKYFKVNVYSPGPRQFVTIFTDITKEREVQERIEYLSYHDQLTGLYNRHFFEEELKRLDVERNLHLTLAMVDVNGLKLTNDAFGHEVGDQLLKNVATVLKRECRTDDIISRIGGDEFVILLPKTGKIDAESIINRIYQSIEVESMDRIVVSVSIGWETKEKMDMSIKEVFSKAENHMYHRKITESQSMRNKTIRVILKTLNECHPRDRIHAERVSRLSRKIGEAMAVDPDVLNEIEVAGLMHDIGKVSIDEEIINKIGALLDDEFEKMKKHSEIGYQILKSTDVYTKIAESVLSHHERWDGKGYPRGLLGEAIPFVARIISVADAYEAMTAERTYRDALSHEAAVDEIIQNAGTQFDPKIVKMCKEYDCLFGE